jgi:hypothetical protein
MEKRKIVTIIILLLLIFVIWIILTDDPLAKYLITIVLLISIWNTFSKRYIDREDTDWSGIILALVVAIVIVVGINLLRPTVGCFWGCDHGGPVSISRETYNRATEDIRSLIAGENLDTSRLEYFLAYEVEPSSHPCSDLTIETCCTWWLNDCQARFHRLLKTAYSNALANHYIAARFFLSLADYVSSKPDCFDCSCEGWYCDDYVFDLSY